MNTDQLTPVVRRWLRHTEATPPDARQSARQVLARMPYVRQRGRWWPLPSLRRKSTSALPSLDREQRFAAIPETPYRFPTATGRTRLMFSPVKVILAGALSLALGGALLVTQPFQAPSGPGGQPMPAGPAAASLITGTLTCDGGDDRIYGDGWYQGHGSLACTSEADDPRVTGPASLDWNFACYREADDSCVFWGVLDIEGLDGSWSGTYTGVDDAVLWKAGTGGAEMVFALTGSGGYDGWSYVFHMSNRIVPTVPVNGLIYEGPLPPWQWTEP